MKWNLEMFVFYVVINMVVGFAAVLGITLAAGDLQIVSAYPFGNPADATVTLQIRTLHGKTIRIKICPC